MRDPEAYYSDPGSCFLIVTNEDESVIGCGALVCGAPQVQLESGATEELDMGVVAAIRRVVVDSSLPLPMARRVVSDLIRTLSDQAQVSNASSVLCLAYARSDGLFTQPQLSSLSDMGFAPSSTLFGTAGYVQTEKRLGPTAISPPAVSSASSPADSTPPPSSSSSLPPPTDASAGDLAQGEGRERPRARSRIQPQTQKPSTNEPRWRRDQKGRAFREYQPGPDAGGVNRPSGPREGQPAVSGSGSSDGVPAFFEIPRSGDLLLIVPAAVILILGVLTTLLVGISDAGIPGRPDVITDVIF